MRRQTEDSTSPLLAFAVRGIGLLLILTSLAVALSREPDRPATSLVARWAPAPSDFIDVKGQIVHIRDEGPRGNAMDGGGDSAPPIVLIHGTASSLHTWEGWVAGLKTQRRVISFDLPGHGLTGPWSDSFTGSYPHDKYEGDGYARFVLDLLDTLKVQRAVLAGNSLGGEVAWRTAYLAPQRVAALVLVDASGPAFKPETIPIGFMIARLPVLNRIGEALLPRGVIEQSLLSLYGDPAKVKPALVDRYFELQLREGNRRALSTRVQNLVIGEDAERIATLKLPTLILWGGRDRLIPPAVGQQFERQIAGSQRVVFERLGHVPQEEDPAATLVPVKAFLGLK